VTEGIVTFSGSHSDFLSICFRFAVREIHTYGSDSFLQETR